MATLRVRRHRRARSTAAQFELEQLGYSLEISKNFLEFVTLDSDPVVIAWPDPAIQGVVCDRSKGKNGI